MILCSVVCKQADCNSWSICRFIQLSGVRSASPVNTCLHHTRTKRSWIQTFSQSCTVVSLDVTCRESWITVIPHSFPLISAPLIKTWPITLKFAIIAYTKHTSIQNFKQQKEELRGNGDVWSVSHTCTAETKASKDTRDLRSVGFLQDTREKRWRERAPLQTGQSQAQTEWQWSTCTLLSLSYTQLRGGVCVCECRAQRESVPHTHTHPCLLNSWELSSEHTHTCTLQSQTAAVVLIKPGSGSRFGMTARGEVVWLWLIRPLSCGRQKE